MAGMLRLTASASIDAEDGERGVTFRVGKFIGQVSIESKYVLF